MSDPCLLLLLTGHPLTIPSGSVHLLLLPGKAHLSLTALLQYLGGDQRYSTSFWQINCFLGTITDTPYRKVHVDAFVHFYLILLFFFILAMSYQHI